MKRALLILVLATLPLIGCSVVAVVPKPAGSTHLSPDGQRLVAEYQGVTVSAGLQEQNAASLSPVDNLVAFAITIANDTDHEVAFPVASMILIDAEGHQFRPVPALQVRDMVSRESSYLVPYPYVGYYYEADNAKAGSINAMTSSLPFYAENHPQDIQTQALADEPVIPGAKLTGLVYFVADLGATTGAELRIYPAGSPMTGPPLYTFAFSVEKH